MEGSTGVVYVRYVLLSPTHLRLRSTFFFFNDTATTEIYTLSLHDALPISEASLAAIFERIKLGIAIAAMIKIIATTMSNSISEKPFCLLRMCIQFSLDLRARLHA